MGRPNIRHDEARREISIPLHVLRDLAELARLHGRTVAAEIRHACARHVDNPPLLIAPVHPDSAAGRSKRGADGTGRAAG